MGTVWQLTAVAKQISMSCRWANAVLFICFTWHGSTMGWKLPKAQAALGIRNTMNRRSQRSFLISHLMWAVAGAHLLLSVCASRLRTAGTAVVGLSTVKTSTPSLLLLIPLLQRDRGADLPDASDANTEK